MDPERHSDRHRRKIRKSILQFINQLFKINMGKKILMFLACAIMSAGIAFAQQQVTGTVVDSETGEPLVGATVKVKGTTQGVLTDMDGKFTLKNLPSRGSTLVVTCMGMKPVEVKSAAKMTINMESVATDLQDVMVVAYGTAKRSAFTGSAAVIGSDHIEKLVTTSVSNALLLVCSSRITMVTLPAAVLVSLFVVSAPSMPAIHLWLCSMAHLMRVA